MFRHESCMAVFMVPGQPRLRFWTFLVTSSLSLVSSSTAESDLEEGAAFFCAAGTTFSLWLSDSLEPWQSESDFTCLKTKQALLPVCLNLIQNNNWRTELLKENIKPKINCTLATFHWSWGRICTTTISPFSALFRATMPSRNISLVSSCSYKTRLFISCHTHTRMQQVSKKIKQVCISLSYTHWWWDVSILVILWVDP